MIDKEKIDREAPINNAATNPPQRPQSITRTRHRGWFAGKDSFHG